jgi:hypothetical protein
MCEKRPGLYDAKVSAWRDGDARKFLIRCLRPAGGSGPGAARAFLSDRHKRIDNLDVLLAALDGVRAAGVPVEVDGCDLTERRMYVRVVSCVALGSSGGVAARWPAAGASRSDGTAPWPTGRAPTPKPPSVQSKAASRGSNRAPGHDDDPSHPPSRRT